MRCKKKKTVRKIKIIVAFALPIVLIFCYLEFAVNPQIVSSNQAQIKRVASQTINESIQQTLQADYDDLVSIEKDQDNNISLISVNSKNVNMLNNDILTTLQNTFDQKKDMKVFVPLGTFTGIPILSGVGKDVAIKIVPIGYAETKFLSKFSSVAINQSCHKIYLNINFVVSVFLPLYTQNIEVTSQVLIAENIIVGKIPNVYLNTNNLTNALNLIP